MLRECVCVCVRALLASEDKMLGWAVVHTDTLKRGEYFFL